MAVWCLCYQSCQFACRLGVFPSAQNQSRIGTRPSQSVSSDRCSLPGEARRTCCLNGPRPQVFLYCCAAGVGRVNIGMIELQDLTLFSIIQRRAAFQRSSCSLVQPSRSGQVLASACSPVFTLSRLQVWHVAGLGEFGGTLLGML